jgi:DNA repair photolyase
MIAPRRVSNPPNPWSTTEVEWLEEAPPVAIEVYEEEARSILSENDSPDVPFRWSVNPYRGCQHACAYCYARPGHQWLGYGAGTDFDSKIVVKTNAAELLRAAFARRGWKRELVAFSGVTDCYQPLEASYGLTRACLEVCREFRNPVGIVTKSALVRRDLELLTRLARVTSVQVLLSIPFADDAMARRIEPWASAPRTRFETLRLFAQAGIETGVLLAPIIPGLNDSQIPRILEAAARAGAKSASTILLRLAQEVRPVFEERLREAYPGRVAKVLHALEEMGGGRISRPDFAARMRGAGPRWGAIEDLFHLHARRLGLRTRSDPGLDPGAAGKAAVQGELF